MSKIVTANYRNRDAKEKWLVRDENERPDAAIAFSTIVAKGVKFKASTGYWEEGFGCVVVAVCEEATGYDELPKELNLSAEHIIPLKFNIIFGFYNFDISGVIEKAEELYLSNTGEMWAKNATADEEINAEAELAEA